MRKMLLTPLTVCTVVLLSTLWMLPARATKPTLGTGTFDSSIPETTSEPVMISNNIQIWHYQGGGGYLFGILEGKWIHDEWDVINLATLTITAKGVWDTPDGVTLVTPNGEYYFGKIHVNYLGSVDLITGEFRGQWFIISGTDQLANLRGGGAVWIDNIYGDINSPTYGGSTLLYHFDP